MLQRDGGRGLPLPALPQPQGQTDTSRISLYSSLISHNTLGQTDLRVSARSRGREVSWKSLWEDMNPREAEAFQILALHSAAYVTSLPQFTPSLCVMQKCIREPALNSGILPWVLE
jgi:hypothetical protein